MDLMGSAKKFIMGEEEEDIMVYEGPRLVKESHLNIIIRTPGSFADVREYADSLMAGSAIMICLDAVDSVLRNRIFDYMNGVMYIVGASARYVNDNLLLYAPKQVSVTKNVTKSRSWLS